MYLANQVYPEDSIHPYKAYLDTTHRCHGYVILDLTQNMKDGLNFRNKLTPADKYPLTVYSDIGDEACEIKLSYPPSTQDCRT